MKHTARTVICLLIGLVLLDNVVLGQAGSTTQPATQPTRQRRPVVWVNPKLPDGPGLTHHILASKALGHDVGYVVWLPPGYDASKRYPVVYFLHGAGGNESGDSAGFSGLVARGIDKGLIEPVICVFPNGGMSGYRGEVATMIIDELIPLIDQTYPTRGAAQRVAAGFSMGGMGSVSLALRHPDLFVGAGSWGGGMRNAEEISPIIRQNATQLKAAGLGLLLINGTEDRPDAFLGLLPVLNETGIPFTLRTLPGVKHNLGRYYELAGDDLVRFLAHQLRANQGSAD